MNSVFEGKEGVMNLGKHCDKCKQLDFLPFTCEFCKLTYCSQHRNPDTHQCPGKQDKKWKPGIQYGGPSAASLFPDRDQDKAKINNMINNSKPKPTSHNFGISTKGARLAGSRV